MPESLHEVVDGVSHLLLGNRVQDREERLEGNLEIRNSNSNYFFKKNAIREINYPVPLLLVLHEPGYLGLRRVLSQRADHLANLVGLEKQR